MSERPKQAAEQIRDLLEPAAALTAGLGEAALASIAISLRRLANVIEHEAHVKTDRDRAAASGWRWGDPVDEKKD